ncbi:MAG: hypothetical protein R3E44_15105 [Paracoccaceae bacterium]
MSQAEYGMPAHSGATQRPAILTAIATMFAEAGAAISTFGSAVRHEEDSDSSTGPTADHAAAADNGYLRDLGTEVNF